MSQMAVLTRLIYLASLLSIGFSVTYSETYCRHEGIPSSIDDLLLNPENCRTYSTCAGNCGMVQILKGFDNTMRCSCDHLCLMYGDCCGDVMLHCPAEHTTALQVVEHYGARHVYDGMTVACSEPIKGAHKIPLIAGCVHDATACVVREDDPFDKIPVTDLDTGIDFINARCAICNGVTNGEIWKSTVYCWEQENLPNRNGSTNATEIRTDDVVSAIETPGCRFGVNLPIQRGSLLRYCGGNIINSCPENCANTALVNACEDGSLDIVHDDYWRNFANPYCALCASNSDTGYEFTCGHISDPLGGDRLPNYNFAVLFRFDSSSGNGVSLPADNIECPAGQEYINEDIGCREILLGAVCPHGFVFQDNSCVAEVNPQETIVVSVQIKTVENANFSQFENDVERYEETVCTLVNETILSRFENMTKTECTANHTLVIGEILINFDFVITWSTPFDLATSIQSNETRLLIEEISYNTTYIFNELYDQGMILNFNMNGRSYALKIGALSCPTVSFNVKEYTLLNNTVKMLSSGQEIGNENFIIRNTTLYVCRDVLHGDKKDNSRDTEELVLSILTIICMSISGIFLIARLILHFLVPVFKTFPMQLQFYYCISLLVSVIIFFLSPIFEGQMPACKIIGALQHFGFLSMFVWMALISADMYKIFSSFEAMQSATERKGFKDMISQHVIGWGLPALIVIITVIVDSTTSEKHDFQPNYGKDRCWLTPEGYSALIFFGIPVFLALVLNIILFILVSIKLRKAFNRRNRTASANQSNWSTYLKLFILMGVSCCFILLTPFIDHVAVWILIIVTSASQGIYIGAVSIFSKQVMTYFRHKFRCCKTEKYRSSEKGTRSTSIASAQSKSKKFTTNCDISLTNGNSTHLKNVCEKSSNGLRKKLPNGVREKSANGGPQDSKSHEVTFNDEKTLAKNNGTDLENNSTESNVTVDVHL